MPLLGRQVRMSDLDWLIFQDMGGADWLRKHLKAKARLPMKHYEAQLKGEKMTPEKKVKPRWLPYSKSLVRTTSTPSPEVTVHRAYPT
jgi:hypothetical protein